MKLDFMLHRYVVGWLKHDTGERFQAEATRFNIGISLDALTDFCHCALDTLGIT